MRASFVTAEANGIYVNCCGRRVGWSCKSANNCNLYE